MPIEPRMVADAVLAAFVVTELLSPGAKAWRSRLLHEGDRGTTAVVMGCLAVALVALNTSVLPGYAISRAVEWLGAAAGVCGLGLRWWAIATRTDPGGRVHRGPYRLIRHPGYLAIGIAWIGATAASGNLTAVLTVALAVGFAGILRIHAEEAMLRREHGASFTDYARSSWRLIPFVY
jgi:protein-S-isoprenylcysteine O-methyltransferase Ste14